MTEPVRVFIGTSANGEDAGAENVIEYTLRKNSKRDLDITWMRQTHDVTSIWGGWKTTQWPTPFSGYRWAIPEACEYKGHAVYMDVDMINFRAIEDLLEEGRQKIDASPGPAMMAARRGKRFGGHEFCVMVFDCTAARDMILPVDRMKQNAYSHFRAIQAYSGNTDYVVDLNPLWNCLDGDGLKVNEMFQLHYTCMATQPWKPAWFKGECRAHPRQDLVDLWYGTLEEAQHAGFQPRVPNDPFGEYDIIGK